MQLLHLENTTIDSRYDVSRCLRQGSYAELYEAFDQQRQCAVIIKALNTSLRGAPNRVLEETLVANFEQEAEVHQSVRHPHIVDLLGQGAAISHSGISFRYLVLEYLAGGDLWEYCRVQPLGLPQAIHYFGQVAAALAAAHARQIIHRDLKPANLLLSADRSNIKIADFGVARLIEKSRGRLITRVGTAIYSPPEHNPLLDDDHQPLTPAADIYSLAKTVYGAMTGRAPSQFRLRQIDCLPPELAAQPWAPKVLAVLRRATADKVSERYASVAEFWSDFSAPAGAVSGEDLADNTEVHSLELQTPVEDKSVVIHGSPKRRERLVIDLPQPAQDAPVWSSAMDEKQAQRVSRSRMIGLSAAALLVIAAVALLVHDLFSRLFDPGPAMFLTIGCAIGLGAVALRVRKRSRWWQARPAQDGTPMRTRGFEVITVDAAGKITRRRRSHAVYFVESLGGGVTLEMVRISGGDFLMGSPETETERAGSEGPRHLVSMSSFFMAGLAVTNEQWRAVARLPKVRCELEAEPSAFNGDRRPVESISWREAVEFCERLSQRTGRNYRLPSEAQWEYACRAGTTTPFHFGETITSELANYDSRLPHQSAPKSVARDETTAADEPAAASAFGLIGMHGNVWEWCADLWHENYVGAPADGRAWISGGRDDLRVVRGGSWFNAGCLCRSAYRYRAEPNSKGNSVGFRVVAD